MHLKIWIFHHLNQILEIILWKPIQNRDKKLRTPGSIPNSVPLRLTVGLRPHWLVWPRGRAPPTSGSRRRWGLRPRGEHNRAPRSEAHPRVPLDRAENDRSTLASMHGGTAALLAVARLLRRSRARAKSRRGFPIELRILRAKKQAKRCRNEWGLTQRSSPARSE